MYTSTLHISLVVSDPVHRISWLLDMVEFVVASERAFFFFFVSWVNWLQSFHKKRGKKRTATGILVVLRFFCDVYKHSYGFIRSKRELVSFQLKANRDRCWNFLASRASRSFRDACICFFSRTNKRDSFSREGSESVRKFQFWKNSTGLISRIFVEVSSYFCDWSRFIFSRWKYHLYADKCFLVYL